MACIAGAIRRGRVRTRRPRVTNWLITEPAAVDGVSGLWALTGDGGIRGTDLGATGSVVTLRGRETLRIGRRELRVFDRRGELALRVFNPRRLERERFSAIDAYPPREGWRISARFEATPGETVAIITIDGRTHETELAGRLHFTLDGAALALAVTRSEQGGLSAVFGDGRTAPRPIGSASFPSKSRPPTAQRSSTSTAPICRRAPSPTSSSAAAATGNRYSAPIRAGERAVVLGR